MTEIKPRPSTELGHLPRTRITPEIFKRLPISYPAHPFEMGYTYRTQERGDGPWIVVNPQLRQKYRPVIIVRAATSHDFDKGCDCDEHSRLPSALLEKLRADRRAARGAGIA